MRAGVVSLIVAVWLAGCSSEAPPPGGKGGISAGSGADSTTSQDFLTSVLSDPLKLKAYVASLASNPAALAAMVSRDKIEALELANLKDTNQKLCLRIQQLRNTCAATHRLVLGDAEKAMACSLGNGEQSSQPVKWEVQLGVARKHRILADNNWESSEFGQGVTTITWSARTPASTLSPRLIDLSQVQILPADGGAVADLGGFTLSANGVPVFMASDVVKANESNGYYIVSMQSVLNLRSSAACQLTQADWDSIVKGGQ